MTSETNICIMSTRLIGFIFLFFIICPEMTLAQQSPPVSNTLSVKEGLVSRKVKNCFQDSYGWIWITTDISLHRYDGYKLERMDKALQITVDQTVRARQIIWEDHEKHIWIQNENELLRYEPLSRMIERYSFKNPSGGMDSIIFALIDWDGRLVVKNKFSGLKYFEGNSFHEIPGTNGDIFNEYEENHLCEMSRGTEGEYILNASRYGSYLLDENFKDYKKFTRSQFRASAGMDEFGFSIKMNPDGRIFGEVRYDYFYEYNSTVDSFTFPNYLSDFPIKTKISNCSVHGQILFSSPGQVWRYSYDTDELERIDYNNHGSHDQLIEHLMIDRTGNIWISSYFGVQKIFQSKNRFRAINPKNHLEFSYPNSIRAIHNLSENELLISSKNLNHIYNIRKDSFITLDHYKNDMWCIEEAEGNLYGVRLNSQGIYRLNRQNNKFELIGYPYNAKLCVTLKYFNGSLWTGDGPLILIYNIAEDNWSKYDWDYGRVNDFYFENENSIYLACDKGFVHTNKDLQVIEVLNKETEPALSSNKVQDIYVEGEDLFWLSTKGGGVCIYDKRTGSVETMQTGNGLPNNTVYAVIPDGSKYWMPTDNGLALYDNRTGNINSFFKKHGLSHNEFNFPSHYSYKDKIYLGTLDGITIIDTSVNYLSSIKPKLFITSFSTFDRKTRQTIHHKLDFNKDKAVILGVRHSNLEFTLSLADYTDTKENRFAYKLDGYMDDWYQMGNNNILRLGNLPSGEYTLHLRGYTNTGIYSEDIDPIAITVSQPFTQSVGFIILLLSVLSILFYLFYRIRLYQINRIIGIRQLIAANLHDDVGSIMTYIALESDLLQAGIYSDEEIEGKLKTIADGSREASMLMSDIVWSFDSRQDKTKSLVDRMRQYLHKMLGSRDINYEFDADQSDMNINLEPDVRQNLYLIFKEAIHNIVKHSNAQFVKVVLIANAKNIELDIIDNGTSAENNGLPSTGQGIRNMESRAKKIGAELEIDSSNGYSLKLILRLN